MPAAKTPDFQRLTKGIWIFILSFIVLILLLRIIVVLTENPSFKSIVVVIALGPLIYSLFIMEGLHHAILHIHMADHDGIKEYIAQHMSKNKGNRVLGTVSVKAGQFAALDCGANPEAWSEIFVQLWDVVDGDRSHMIAGKFAAIIRKVSEHVALDPGARLTFEVSDGIAPMQLHCAGAPVYADGILSVALSARRELQTARPVA